MARASAQLKRSEPRNDVLPPQDLDAEQNLLASIILNSEVVGQVLPIVGQHEAHRFYQPDHQELFKLLIHLYDQNKPIDLVVVRDEIRRRNLQKRLTDEFVVDLVQSVATWRNVEHYARIVRDKSMLRELISCTNRIMADAYEESEEAKTILDRAEQAIFNLTEQRITTQAQRLGETLTNVYRMIEAHGTHHVSGLPTGYIELDELSCGLQPGEMIVIAGRPSMGKTALGLNIAERMSAEEKIPVAFFSMEMSRQQVAQRVLCSRGNVDAHKLRRGMLNEREIAELAYVCQTLEESPLYIDDTPGMNILELRAKVRRMRRLGIRAVFVDYLQLMQAPGEESRQQEISFISRGLKALAREMNIPVVAMAQLNRSSEIREGHRPRMSDLRESGAIEQDADVVMLLHREEYYKPDDIALKGKAELIIAKQRNGPTGTIMLHFNKHLTRFDTLSMAPEPFVSPAAVDDDAPF